MQRKVKLLLSLTKAECGVLSLKVWRCEAMLSRAKIDQRPMEKAEILGCCRFLLREK